MTSVDDFLMGGGGKSASFENLGDSVEGTITALEVRQQTDIKDGTPKVWDDGTPRQQLVISLQTAERVDEDDDGVRNFYAKGSRKTGSKSSHEATVAAVKAAGAKSLEIGGYLKATYVETKANGPGLNDSKLYRCEYRKPTGEAAAAAYLADTPAAAPQAAQQAAAAVPVSVPAPAPAQVQAAPVAAPAAAPAAGGQSPVELAKELLAAGLDADTVAASVPGLAPAVIKALANAVR